MPIGAAQQPFVVVIDAGHGGHDPGALGSVAKEKDLNLSVALRIGQLIEQNYSDVKVVYTRKTDVFLALQERADIVNKNKANLFICVHTNSADAKSANGAEVFTLGLNKTQSNLDVAMRENAVMLLEDDYQTRYQGFDPNSVESYIMFEFMQDQYIDRSLLFASKVQDRLVAHGRADRGVRQAAFWVLHKSACPSVLIEMGFITNRDEERFLASKAGQEKVAQAVYDAFGDYKRQVEKKSGKPQAAQDKQPTKTQPAQNQPAKTQPAQNQPTKTQPTQNQPAKTQPATTPADKQKAQQSDANRPVYKIQIFAVDRVLAPNDWSFHGVKDATYYQENGLYKYTVGEETDYDKIVQRQQQVKEKFPDCFIIAFVNGKKTPVSEARAIK